MPSELVICGEGLPLCAGVDGAADGEDGIAKHAGVPGGRGEVRPLALAGEWRAAQEGAQGVHAVWRGAAQVPGHAPGQDGDAGAPKLVHPLGQTFVELPDSSKSSCRPQTLHACRKTCSVKIHRPCCCGAAHVCGCICDHP